MIEYHVEVWDAMPNHKQLKSKLDELGAGGWRMVYGLDHGLASFKKNDRSFTLLFMREAVAS